MTNGTVAKGGISHPALEKRINNINEVIRNCRYSRLFLLSSPGSVDPSFDLIKANGLSMLPLREQ